MAIQLTTKKIGDIKGRFIVPDYQRGYRWTTREVERLLRDIPTVMSTDGKNDYCLQPLVVRRLSCGENQFELIDGQQRLTTLYIILKSIEAYLPIPMMKPQYSIAYESRPGSEDFLNTLFTEDREASNQDFWFMKEAARVTRDFIDKKFQKEADTSFLINFFSIINRQLEVIWYEVGDIPDSEAIDLFERLNIGKIALTNSELIKALFLRELHEHSTPTRADEMALLWEEMELRLSDDAVWGFLTAEKPDQYDTRIDLIINTITGHIQQDTEDPYAPFFNFSDKLAEKGADNLWDEIHGAYLTIMGWYSDHELYHLAGCLVASRHMTLTEIYRLWHNGGKPLGLSAFRKRLRTLLAESLTGKKLTEANARAELAEWLTADNLLSLNYTDPEGNASIRRILLAYNVIGELESDNRRRRFPFARHRRDNWTLEHIHAQQTESLSKNEQISDWLGAHIPLLEGREDFRDLLPEMKELKSDLDSGKKVLDSTQRYKKIYSEVWPAFTNGSQALHDLSNMTLLTQGQNSAVSNYIFEAKRALVSEWDSKGHYIPWGTRRVFFKNFKDADASQIGFWSPADRKAYIAEIISTLSTII